MAHWNGNDRTFADLAQTTASPAGTLQWVAGKEKSTMPTVAEHPPFRRYDQFRHFYVVQLRQANLEAVAYFMLQNGKGAVAVPADRQSFQWGDKRFDLGDWVALEWIDEGGLRWAMFRHATEHETKTFGLSNG